MTMILKTYIKVYFTKDDLPLNCRGKIIMEINLINEQDIKKVFFEMYNIVGHDWLTAEMLYYSLRDLFILLLE